jgi:hypothetical protein
MAASMVTSKRPCEVVVIKQRVAERLEGRAGLVDAVDQVEQLARAAAEPIQLGDEDDVALAERCRQLGELRPVTAGPGNLLAEYRGSISGLERGELTVEGLAVSADTSVADDAAGDGPVVLVAAV